MTDYSLLYIDVPGYQPLPAADVLKIAGKGTDVHSVTDESAALAILDSLENVGIVLSNAPSHKVFEKARAKHPKAHNMLLTELPMKRYSTELQGEEDKLLDHIIANRVLSEWTTNELRITLQKVVRKDIFGIDKYLLPNTHINQVTVKGSEEREEHNSRVMKFAEECNLSSHIAKMIYGISEELLMNAIYDAPLAAGKRLYHDLPRTTKILLDPEEYATLTYGCDGQVFAVAISDPFGRLAQEKLNQYVKKVLHRRDSASIIDTKKGGAGLGLFKILYSSHSLVCNVKENEKTEIIALIDVHEQLRDFAKMARSIHYFKLP